MLEISRTLLHLAVIVMTVEAANYDDISSLYSNLTSRINPQLRPELQQSQYTTIYTSFSLVSLLDIDEVEGTVKITGYFSMFWIDSNLNWVPSDYGGAQKVTFPQTIIWTPPLIIKNTATAYKMIGITGMQIKVAFDGSVFWMPGESITFTCSIDSTYFPFDTQQCNFDLVIWGFDADEVYLTPSITTIDTSEYSGSGEWDLIRTSVYERSSGISFNMYFKRQPMFLVISVLLPVMFVSLLNIFAFILPQESGERLGFSITALLSIVVFLTIAQGLLPATALPRLSAICVNLTVDMFMSGCITVSVIYSSLLYHRSADKPVPLLIKKLVRLQFGCYRKSEHKNNNDLNKNKVIHFEKGMLKEEADAEPVTWQRVSEFWDTLSLWVFTIWFLIATVVFIVDVATGNN